jgi:acetylornithine deacetylase/succinyl-diaminopimelate desuccinylase-like protein
MLPPDRDPGETRFAKNLVHGIMEDVFRDLAELVRIPSVAFPGFDPAPVYRMARETCNLQRRYGLGNSRLIDVPGGYPLVYGEIPPPEGGGTILMYAHYDVQPAEAGGWTSAPWIPEVRDGRLFGRGAADNKSGIVMIAATIRALGPRPPVGIRVVIEGEEETTSHLGTFIKARSELFQCDLFLIADMGGIIFGEPALPVTLRDEATCIITIRTHDHAVHSGSFGGAAPHALIVLIRTLVTLHDARGDVTVPGLMSGGTVAGRYPDDLFRAGSGILPCVDLVGTGTVGERIWSSPSVTVIGIDAPTARATSNSLIPTASARISMRTAPGADPDREIGILMEYLRKVVPWNAAIEIQKVRASQGFICPTNGTGLSAARSALEEVFEKTVQFTGGGGSIPSWRFSGIFLLMPNSCSGGPRISQVRGYMVLTRA